MRNLYTKFVKFLEICKQFSKDLVAEKGNILRPGPVPHFSDLEVIAMCMAAESEDIDSENWLFEARLKECKDSIPNLISRRLSNALCGLSGVIHSYDLSKASVHDIHYIKDIKTIYHDCCIIGDKGYIRVERCNLTCSKQQTSGSNVHTDSIKRIGSLLFLHLQRREKE